MSGSAFVAPLALEIDSRPAAAAATALDQMTAAAGRAEARVGQIKTAADALVAALTKNTAATEALTTKLLAIEAASAKAGAAVATVGTAADATAANVVKLDRATVTAKTGLDNIAVSARNATAAWAALGAMGSATAEKLEIARRMAAASAVIAPPPIHRIDQAAGWAALGSQGATTAQQLDVARRMAAASALATPQAANQNGGGLSRAQQANLVNLFQQGADVAVTGAMGMSPFMIALQQGPQIAQSFAGPGALSLSQVFSTAADKAGALATRLGPVTLGLGAITAAAGVGAVAMLTYRSAQQEVERSIGGVGRATGVTLAQINALADAGSRAAGLSRASARDAAAVYVGQGRVGSDLLGDAVGATRDFAKFMGMDEADGAAALAAALGDVSKGATDLSQRYGLLSASQAENVQRMDAQGNRLAAQRTLLDAVRESTKGLTEQTTGWGRVTQGVSDLWDDLGRSVDKAVTGGDLDTRLKTAQDALAEARRDASGSTAIYRQVISDPQIATYEKQVADLQKLVDRRNGLVERLQRNQRSVEISGLVRSLAPEIAEFQTLQDRAERLRKAIADPMKFGLDGGALGQTEAAFGRISQTIKTMADDIERFGSAAAAAAYRSAEFNSRTVGFTPAGRTAAEVQQRYESDMRLKGLDPNGPTAAQVESSYTARFNQPGLNFQDLYRLTQQRDEETRAAQERDTYRRVRDTELETRRRTQSLEQAQVGGVFSRLSQEVQQQFLTAAQNPRYARIPVEIAAAITGPESGGNLDVGYSRSLGEDGRRSSAYGLGQITAGTAADAIRRGYLPPGYDRTNRETMAEGILGVLSMKRDDNGGDLTRAIMAYRGSSDPAVNRAYAARVMRDAGQMGDASALGQVRDQDANSRALQQANDNLKNVTENYGRNAVALEANGRAQDQYRQLIERGVPAATAASIAFDGMQTKIATVAQAARFIQFDRDDTFAREQLGRSRTEQQAFAAARPYAGTAFEATVLSRTRDTAELYEARSMVTDGMTSFVTDLRRGGDAATALTNAFGNAADRLIAKVMDSAISSAFGAFGGPGGGSSGGIGGLFSSMFGGAAGAGSPTGGVRLFANGGIMTPQGSVPLRAYSAGGVANSPQLALYGEGRMPEAYVPLPDGRRIPVAMQGAANGNAAPSTPSFNLIDQRPAGSPDIEPTVNRRSDGGFDVIVRGVEGRMGQRAASGQGPFKQAAGGAGYRNG